MSELPSPIRRSAARLRLVTIAGILLFEAGVAAGIWLLLSGRRDDFPSVRVEVAGLAPWPGALSLALTGLLVGIALWRLAGMLAKVAAGAPFSAAADLRGFAFWLFLAVLGSILAPPLLTLALAHGGASGSEAKFSLDNGDALMLLVSGLLFLVARLLDEAQRLADEHEQIV